MGVALCSKCLATDGEDNCQEPVKSHEDQSVDGDEGSGNNEELVHFAPQVSKRPGRRECIIGCCKRNTEDDEQNIGNLK